MPHKLLLADDSVTIQRVIELTFADEDVQVIAVGDGREAIQRIEADPPDIVLADIGMPEKDGYEVAAFVKNSPRYSHIPVLLLTGAFEPIDEQRAQDVGCDGVLAKPFEPQMVITRVNELLAAAPPRLTSPGQPSAAAHAPAPVPVPPPMPAVAPPPPAFSIPEPSPARSVWAAAEPQAPPVPASPVFAPPVPAPAAPAPAEPVGALSPLDAFLAEAPEFDLASYGLGGSTSAPQPGAPGFDASGPSGLDPLDAADLVPSFSSAAPPAAPPAAPTTPPAAHAVDGDTATEAFEVQSVVPDLVPNQAPGLVPDILSTLTPVALPDFDPGRAAPVPEPESSGVREMLEPPSVRISRRTPIAIPGFGAPALPTPGTQAELDDYFEKLDAAFASLNQAAPPPTVRPAAVMGAAGEKPFDVYEPRPADLPAAPAAPAGAPAAVPSAVPEPIDVRSGIADAFSALLAAEHGQSIPVSQAVQPFAPLQAPASVAAPSPAVAPAPASAITPELLDDLVERVAQRVLERMSDRTVRDTVTDVVSRVAERLVRDEIERVKSTIK